MAFIVVNRGGYPAFEGQIFPSMLEAQEKIFNSFSGDEVFNYKVIDEAQQGKLQSLIIANRRDLKNQAPPKQEQAPTPNNRGDIDYLKGEIEYLKRKVKQAANKPYKQPLTFTGAISNICIFFFNLTVIPILFIYLLIVLGG